MSITPEEILGWSSAFRRLVEASAREGLAHAYLIESESAEGSAFYARAFARAINCVGEQAPAAVQPAKKARGKKTADADTSPPLAKPCGRCEPCRRAAAGAFPALTEYYPIGVAVTIAQIQTLIQATTARFGAGVTKVFVIHAADRMQIPAANALLKTLEEPPERTVLVLATSSASRVLPTIRSRCRAERLSLPDDAELARRLELDPAGAARLALAMEVSGRQPSALLELAAKPAELTKWTPPAGSGELLALTKKLARAHKDGEALTPEHGLVAGGWYALALAGALAAVLDRLAAGAHAPGARRDALAAAAHLTELHKWLLEAADDDAAEKVKELTAQYGDSYTHPQMGEGKVSYPLGRAHSALLLRAFVAVLRRALHAAGDAGALGWLVAGARPDGLARLDAGVIAGLARHAEAMRNYAAQNVAVPYVLDELFLGAGDVLAGRAAAVAADEHEAEVG
jgi:hypothetical protein